MEFMKKRGPHANPTHVVRMGRGGARKRVEFLQTAETELSGLCDDDMSTPSKKDLPNCKYNDGVFCDRKEGAGCRHCGWEPELNARRREAIRKTKMADDWYHKIWQYPEPLERTARGETEDAERI